MSVAPDAVPDTSVTRVQVVLAARGGRRAALGDAAHALAGDAARRLGADHRVIVLRQLDDDPFPAANPLCRPFDVVVEVQAAHTDDEVLLDALAGDGSFTDRLGEHAHLDLSGVLVGSPQDLIATDPTPLRYLYFMRRRADTSRHDYFDHYFHRHSRFGFATPNIAGYTQFHLDPARSRAAASRLGMGSVVYDSVSELHLDSLESFFAGIGDGRLGAEAGADEETFVDRENSVSICTLTDVIPP